MDNEIFNLRPDLQNLTNTTLPTTPNTENNTESEFRLENAADLLCGFAPQKLRRRSIIFHYNAMVFLYFHMNLNYKISGDSCKGGAYVWAIVQTIIRLLRNTTSVSLIECITTEMNFELKVKIIVDNTFYKLVHNLSRIPILDHGKFLRFFHCFVCHLMASNFNERIAQIRLL